MFKSTKRATKIVILCGENNLSYMPTTTQSLLQYFNVKVVGIQYCIIFGYTLKTVSVLPLVNGNYNFRGHRQVTIITDRGSYSAWHISSLFLPPIKPDCVGTLGSCRVLTNEHCSPGPVNEYRLGFGTGIKFTPQEKTRHHIWLEPSHPHNVHSSARSHLNLLESQGIICLHLLNPCSICHWSHKI